jgi:predicted ATP-dependent endonuclease of OLD family
LDMPKRQTYIKDIRLAGYKSIKNVSCDFDEGLNIIIGNNGSGKSNLLEFIDKILTRKYVGLNLFHADLSIEIGDNSYITGDMSPYANGIFHWNAAGTISKEKRDLENIGTIIKEPEVGISIYTEFIRFNLPEKIGVLSKELNPSYNLEDRWLIVDSVDENIPFVLVVWLRTIFSDLDSETVDKAANLNNASLFEMLTNSFNDHFVNLKSRLFAYTPISDIRFSDSIRIVKIDATTLEFRNIVLEYKIENDWFSWEALSDGTKRLIYTVFVINGFDIYPDGTKFFPITFIEEPELGIHPHQLHLFLNFLKEKAEEQQIIITTHSPQVLDILEPDKLNKITIAEISYENGTILRHLNNAEILRILMINLD